MSETQMYHWFMTAAFAALAAIALVNPRCFTRILPYFKQMRTRGWAYDRIVTVATRREGLESAPRMPGYLLGVLSVVLAWCAATTNLSPSLCYAVFCVVAAVILATVFMRMRSAQPVRVATLAARVPEHVIPRSWAVAALAVAALPLIDLGMPELRWMALAVAVSAVVIVVTGWSATEMPAVLEGRDLPVERFVDARLRVIRARNIMGLATFTSFFYFSQTMVVVHWSAPRVLAMLASVGVMEAFLIVSVRNMFEGPPPEELERWQFSESA